MKFVVLGLDSVQPCWENLSSDYSGKSYFFRIKIIIITINIADRTFESESYK